MKLILKCWHYHIYVDDFLPQWIRLAPDPRIVAKDVDRTKSLPHITEHACVIKYGKLNKTIVIVLVDYDQ